MRELALHLYQQLGPFFVFGLVRRFPAAYREDGRQFR